jgi:hypothetical protein
MNVRGFLRFATRRSCIAPNTSHVKTVFAPELAAKGLGAGVKMAGSRVSFLWKDARATEGYQTGVSLHSHTNQSKETLDIIARLATGSHSVGRLLRWEQARAQQNRGFKIDYAQSYWTPPLTPRLAFDLERGQIENLLGLQSLVSISDHDNIQAPRLLRTVASARHIPISVEWTAPFGGDQAFHLGIHNLPSESGADWMGRFERFTANPSDIELTRLLSELNELPNLLIVFNHPQWDLYEIGHCLHAQRRDEFLAQNGRFIHAFELNGLRTWEENRAVVHLARRFHQLFISGGDRHGLEPNANVNLTRAASFNEFVNEIRRERRSHVLFMPQYEKPWKHRIFQQALEVLRDYPEFPQGSRRWDDRVFYPDLEGVGRPLAQLWPNGQAPLSLRLAVEAVRLMGHETVSWGLRFAWSENEQQFALGEREAS